MRGTLSTGEAAIARKRRKPKQPPKPAEARRVAMGLTAAEVALALLLAWLLTRSDLVHHASRAAELVAGDMLVLVSALGCIAVMAFVLAVWQWRLRGRDRVRLLLACYLALMMSFCGLCWFDVSVRSATLPEVGEATSALARAIEQMAATTLTLGSLLAGLVAVIACLWAARRAMSQRAAASAAETTG